LLVTLSSIPAGPAGFVCPLKLSAILPKDLNLEGYQPVKGNPPNIEKL
jgi:hypothetical protein